MTLAADVVPRFRRGVKLREDRARGGWVLLAPEKAFVPDEIGAQVLQLVDGTRTIGAIAAELAATFEAPLDEVREDVGLVLADLVARGAIEA